MKKLHAKQFLEIFEDLDRDAEKRLKKARLIAFIFVPLLFLIVVMV